ncbi:hypothetical protein EC991_009823, partial [Linnemannia zychae]
MHIKSFPIVIGTSLVFLLSFLAAESDAADINITIPLGAATLNLRGTCQGSTIDIGQFAKLPFLPEIALSKLQGDVNAGVEATSN